MDNKLLDALNNIGLALEALSEVISDKKESTSEISNALKSGDFGKQLATISEDIKSIKADTQEILKQQKTILSQANDSEKKSKLGIMDSLGKDDSMMKNIAKGIGVIMLLAVAVLAIGMAFKLVGNVDIISVIGLALGITIISIAFEKISSLKLDLKGAAIVSGVMIISSFGLMVSSKLLDMISPISPVKMLTAIAISAGFAIVGPSIAKIIGSFRRLGFMDLIKTVVFLPIILPAIALGISLSSDYLQNVKSIGLSQFFSSILISGIFVVLAFGLRRMIGAFKGIGPIAIVMGAIFLPIILIQIAKTISEASDILSDVKMISLGSFFGSILVSAIFVVLSYGIRNMISAFRGIDPIAAIVAAIFLPDILVSISKAIAESSEILANVEMISLGAFFGAILVSAVFVVISYGIRRMISAFKGIDPATAILASITIPILMVAISGAIWLSSHILDNMVVVDENKLINAGLIGAGLAIIAIALVPTIKILSKLSLTDILKGALIIPILAGVIMVSSLILNLGKYEKYPGVGWVIGVGLSIAAFGVAAVLLGTQALNPFFYAGLGVTLLVVGTIMASSHIFAMGNYDEYPGVSWIGGVGMSLTLFGASAIILGLQAINPFFYAGLGMTLLVAKTIVETSHILADGKYSMPGFLDWAKGVSLLYLTFTPIMIALGVVGLANAVISFFGPDPWKMAEGMILDIARTIVSVSYVLSVGNWKKGPTEEWAEGVAIAIGAFSQVYAMLINSKSIESLKDVGPKEFTEAIETVIDGIVSAANKLSDAKSVFKNPPPYEWALGVGEAIGAFAPVYTGLILAGITGKEDFGPEAMVRGVQTMTEGIIAAAETFAENTAPFEEGKYPSVEWGEGVGASLGAFAPVFEALQGKKWYQSGTSVINNMTNGIRAISNALVDSAKAFSGYYFDWETMKYVKGEKVPWDVYPSASWAEGVGNSVSGFLDIFDELENRGYTTAQFSILSQVLNYGLSAMSRAARTLFFNKEYFDVELNPDFIQNISKNVLGFAKLGLMLDEMLVSEKIITKETKGFLGIGDSTETETVRETKDLGIVDMVVANMVRVARTLFHNKKYFEDTSVYDGFYRDIISFSSGIIPKFSRLASYLFNKDYDNFYTGLWRTNYISRSLVRMARILYSGQEYFGMSIDPNYMKNVGQNILDFNELVKQLIESEGGKGFWDTVTGAWLGYNDPISQIARRMITLADGYDKLANSLMKLGTAMQMLNISDVSRLGGLTRTIISPSESGSIKEALTGSSPTMQTGDTSLLENFFGEKDDDDDDFIVEDPIQSRLDQVITLLTSINNNTVNINEFIEMQSDGEIEMPTDVQN